MCNSPLNVKNPRLRALHRSYSDGVISRVELDAELSITPEYITVPCGKCEGCAEAKSIEWCHRLECEISHAKKCFFITLTYDNDHLPLGGNVCKHDVSLFIRYLRRMEWYPIKELRKNFPLRYFFISEYGPKSFRPHYHGIVFLDVDLNLDEFTHVIEHTWNKGFVSVDLVNDNRLKYVARYCNKFFNTPPVGKEDNFLLCSQKPFIGCPPGLDDNFLLFDYVLNHVIEKGYCPYSYMVDGKHKVVHAPRVFRNKFIKADLSPLLTMVNVDTRLKVAKSVLDTYGLDYIDRSSQGDNVVLHSRFVKSKKSRKL